MKRLLMVVFIVALSGCAIKPIAVMDNGFSLLRLEGPANVDFLRIEKPAK